MYKWLILVKKNENNVIEVIVDGIGYWYWYKLWLNQKHVEEELRHKNLPVITNKYGPLYKKHRYELVDRPKKQPKQKIFTS